MFLFRLFGCANQIGNKAPNVAPIFANILIFYIAFIGIGHSERNRNIIL